METSELARRSNKPEICFRKVILRASQAHHWTARCYSEMMSSRQVSVVQANQLSDFT